MADRKVAHAAFVGSPTAWKDAGAEVPGVMHLWVKCLCRKLHVGHVEDIQVSPTKP